MDICKYFFVIVICISLFSCGRTKKQCLPSPRIESGIAKVTGRIVNFEKEEGQKEPVVYLSCPNSVTSETIKLQSNINNDGGFYFEMPVVCDLSLAILFSDIFKSRGMLVELSVNKEAQIEIILDKIRACLNFIEIFFKKCFRIV